MPRSRRADAFLRVSAALVGTVPPSLYASLALATFVPASPEVRAALGFYAPLPLYALFGCLAVRARGGVVAWAACALGAVGLKVALLLHG